jgi:hypothetical protein
MFYLLRYDRGVIAQVGALTLAFASFMSPFYLDYLWFLSMLFHSCRGIALDVRFHIKKSVLSGSYCV